MRQLEALFSSPDGIPDERLQRGHFPSQYHEARGDYHHYRGASKNRLIHASKQSRREPEAHQRRDCGDQDQSDALGREEPGNSVTHDPGSFDREKVEREGPSKGSVSTTDTFSTIWGVFRHFAASCQKFRAVKRGGFQVSQRFKRYPFIHG